LNGIDDARIRPSFTHKALLTSQIEPPTMPADERRSSTKKIGFFVLRQKKIRLFFIHPAYFFTNIE